MGLLMQVVGGGVFKEQKIEKCGMSEIDTLALFK